MATGGSYEIPDELLKSLDCPICKERFIEPKIIDCTHVFCLDCLQNYIEKETRNFPPCPVCRKPINVPDKGVSAYQTQTFYADVIQCLQTQADESVRCKSCRETNLNSSRKKCEYCKKFVCAPCMQDRQYKCCENAELNSQLSSNLVRRPSKCQSHCNERLEFYCNDCLISICKQCKDVDHVNHNMQSLHTAAINCKKTLLSVQESLEVYLGETREAAEDLQSFMNEFSSKVIFTKKKIETEFNNIVHCINEKKARLLGELQDIDRKTKKRFETELEEMQTKDVRAKTLDELANNLVKYGSDAEAVQFEKGISYNWNRLQEETLYRYGKGFRLGVQFQLKERVPEMLACEIGTLTVSQYLSPWPRHKNLDSASQGSLRFDQKSLEMKLKDPSWQIFPMKRSKVFSNLVNSHYRLGASKICSVTGITAIAWIKLKQVEKSPSIAGRVFGSKPNSADRTPPSKTYNAVLEVAVYNDPSVEPRCVTMDNIPETTDVRLAVNERGVVTIALYPGRAILTESKKQGSFKRLSTEDDCIYVAMVRENGKGLDEGELRKIDILTLAPDYTKLLFEITKQGVLAVHHSSFSNVFVYPTSGEKRATKISGTDVEIVGICESKDEGILIVSVLKGTITCEEYTTDCTLKYSFSVVSSLNMSTLCPRTEFRNVCSDMRGNILLHFRKDEIDQLSIICAGESKGEILQKPEMFHKVDQMAILPEGRICLFDKTECVLMTLQYLQ